MKQDAQLMAMICVDSVEDARAFCVDKLGFTQMMGKLGKDGQVDFCTVSLGGARVMLMRPAEGITGTNVTTSKRPVELYMEAEDGEAFYDQLKKQKPTSRLTDQWWGDRTFTMQDPFGYQIWFFRNVAEPQLPAGAKVV